MSVHGDRSALGKREDERLTDLEAHYERIYLKVDDAGRPWARAVRHGRGGFTWDTVALDGKRPKPKGRLRALTASRKATGSNRKAGTQAKSKRGHTRPRFEPAAQEDFDAVHEALELAAQAAEDESPMTAQQRVERDESVLAGIAMGLRQSEVARRAGISTASVSRIVAAERERRRTSYPDGVSILWDALAGLEANIATMAALEDATAPDGTADQAKRLGHLHIGAVKAKDAMQLSRLELLVTMGLVGIRPSDDERGEQARDFAVRLVRHLREQGVDEDMLAQASAEALGAARPGVHVLARATDARRSA